MYHISFVKNIVFLKTSMQQGQAYIPIIRFPDLNYGIKSHKL